MTALSAASYIALRGARCGCPGSPPYLFPEFLQDKYGPGPNFDRDREREQWFFCWGTPGHCALYKQ